jgi:hypothetical protein
LISLLAALAVPTFAGTGTFWTYPHVSLSETALLSANPLPLMALDLYPAPVRDLGRMDLDPRRAALAVGPGSVRPQFRGLRLGDAAFDATILSLVALNVADYLSTRECLKYPGLSEGNPLMKPFVKDAGLFAAVKGGLTVLSAIGTKAVYKRSKPLGWIVSLASNAALAYAVSNNYRLLRQARQECPR